MPGLAKAADPKELAKPGWGDTTRVGEIALDWSRMVQLALASFEEGDTLADVLFDLNREACELALRHEVAAVGGEAASVSLENKAVLKALRKESEQSAKSIVKTFERDLLRFVDKAREEGATAAELPRLIAQWNLERSMWKDAQIAITESARAAGQAQREFIARTGAKGKASFGNSLQCAVCQEIAAGNPYALDDETVGLIPHVSCLDYWDIEYAETPEPWLGG